jgi:hypothetical protein
MLPFELTPDQRVEQYARYRSSVNEWFPTRAGALNRLCDHYEDRLLTAPASGTEHYHNAFPGGYVEHVLRVVEYTELQYKMWKHLGFNLDNFTMEELRFAALHHDLGKLGLPGDSGDVYQPNPSDWHVKNQGKVYQTNPDLPMALIQDTSLYILQHFGVAMSYNEYYSIRVHDGPFDRANEAYWINNGLGGKFRTNLPMILHAADAMAARREFERWAKASGKFKYYFFTDLRGQ